MSQSQTAFELLLEIDQRCRLLAADLPSQETRQHSWSGIGFRLGEHWYVAAMGEISEVLHEPRYTLLPGVKPWVKGVANLRGRLLPIMDLCGFFGHELSPLRKQRRVLVVEYKELFAGLLVDEVAGLQHFAQDSLEPGITDFADAAVNPYLQGQFRRDQVWQVFSPFALARSPGFLEVAA
ncbi:purine-binding chemotaxis protein CheW [Pseudomonas protegens]|jgi:twitching motility protein PilI|uniref:Type IV pilus biogenesis protein PilI n=4 Tax=Pseudomonas TaxID=286 RepID=Q4K4F0_PSEF5|nr:MULTISPECIES: chemotaxis protein CheW [Pseudomonas]BCQ65510.1 protein PilI [Pseudomonas sp. Boi14]GED76904.1 protein PilI [Pseudomonas fluorescens]AAY95015.1 type IV pilus biogenesis protein PilI [Pseudomonas protegens Pf-5]AGL87508.1 protein PilI [Pseudomonas protegens CHA0]APC22643.1 chemotaxis protein CheW [Pseudomonas protegens]